MKIRRNDKMRKLPVVLLGGLLLLSMTVLVAQAQGPSPDVVPAVTAKDATALSAPSNIDAGIGSPAPTGFTVQYMFTGVANEAGAGNDQATSINCTNFSNSAAVEVRVEIYNSTPGAPFAANQTIGPGSTNTWSSQSIDAYNDGTILAGVPNLFQGSGRILVRQHRQIICSVQVLDADADPPVYATRLTVYDRFGRIARHVRNLYLPLVRR